jgi:hypothetical protein
MSKREELLSSIADIIKDYRAGEIPKPTPQHVERWVCQFSDSAQLSLLAEMEHLLKITYFTKKTIGEFFGNQIKHKKIAGENYISYWKSANLLDIQEHGHSQSEILELFDKSLEEQCGYGVEDCGSKSGEFIYVDDVLFSGGRIGTDLKTWINDEAPKEAKVHILVIGAHRLGEWQCVEGLKKAAKEAGKDIAFESWAAIRFENRKYYKNISEVLWPAVLPDNAELVAYMAQEKRFPFEPRMPGGKLAHDIFTGEEGRQLLEREMLLAGIHIRSKCKEPKPSMRPLGFSPFGLGFGATIVTFRNCPNNCPLALWWGDPEVTSGAFHWYPLLPRKTYEQSFDFSAFGF